MVNSMRIRRTGFVFIRGMGAMTPEAAGRRNLPAAYTVKSTPTALQPGLGAADSAARLPA
jgi:hypothetical protein